MGFLNIQARKIAYACALGNGRSRWIQNTGKINQESKKAGSQFPEFLLSLFYFRLAGILPNNSKFSWTK
jgi:hypothetical protein